MALSIDELTEVVGSLLEDFEGWVPFETLCTTLRACADEHPLASAHTVERVTRARLLHGVPRRREPTS